MDFKMVIRLSAITAAFLAIQGLPDNATAQTSETTVEQSDEYVISLYGQSFTIDTSLIKADPDDADIGLALSDVGSLVSEAMPGIRGTEDVRDIPHTLATLTDIGLKYESLAYDAQRSLAERLEALGHIELTLAGLDPDVNSDVFNLVRQELAYSDASARVDHIEAYIHDWFRTPSWEKTDAGKPKPAWESFVDRYNVTLEAGGKPSLDKAQFKNPHQWYKYYVATSYLNALVQESPEVKALKDAVPDVDVSPNSGHSP